MEFVRFAVAVVLVLCSVTPSKAAATTTPASGGGGGGDAHSMPCIQKLMPCQPYLHSATPPPPPSCCVPLRQIVDSDVTCLCSVFNNVDMLKSLNLTKDNALLLPKACGANADVSQCKAGGATTPPTSKSPATPETPPASSTGSGSSGNSASSTAKASSSAPANNFAGLSFVSAFVATLFF